MNIMMRLTFIAARCLLVMAGLTGLVLTLSGCSTTVPCAENPPLPPEPYFQIIGEVEHSGTWPLASNATLKTAIDLGGGMTEFASGQVDLLRLKKSEPLVVETTRVDFAQSPDALEAFSIQHGDRILVRKGPVLYFRGEMAKRRTYYLLELPFREQETLADAIGRAGGLTPFANWKRVQVERSGEFPIYADLTTENGPVLKERDQIEVFRLRQESRAEQRERERRRALESGEMIPRLSLKERFFGRRTGTNSAAMDAADGLAQ